MTNPEDADLETPVEDAAEQSTSAFPDDLEDDEEPDLVVDDEARVVGPDDEYR